MKNIGEVPLDNLQLYDSLGGLLPIDTLPTLAPGEEHTFNFTWTVTQPDIDNGYVVNSATLTYTFLGFNGTPRVSNPVYVIAGENGHLPEDGDTIPGDVPHFPGLTGIHEDGEGVNCSLELEALGEGEAHYHLTTCYKHSPTLFQTAELEPKEAAALWREEIEKLYTILYEAGDDLGKATVLNDRIVYWAYVEMFSALYQDDQALCDMLRLRCNELCFMINTAPAQFPSSLTGDYYATLLGSPAVAESCARVVDDEKGEVTFTFDPNHAAALTETLDLLRETSPYAADQALIQAQTFWAGALDRLVNQRYKAADRDARKLIAAWRINLDSVIGVRKAFLDLLYEARPEVPAEAIMNLYRDALIDACSHK